MSLKNKMDNKFLHEYLVGLAEEKADKSDSDFDTRIKTKITSLSVYTRKAGGTN